MMLRIDVVIPTRHREHLLARVIRPLLEDPAVERIVVVDDDEGGQGADGPTLASLSDRIELIATGGVGPAKARQAGAEHARAELLLFLDDDVVPDAHLASRHAAHHERSAQLLVCGYTPVVPRPAARLSAAAEVYGCTYEDRCRLYDADRSVVLTHLWGGNFSLRREDALRIGLADERFRETSHEDRDFGLRCLEAGLTAVFDRALRAGHEYERAWPEVAAESYRRGYSVVLLHQLHGTLIGPFDERQFERNLPRPVAAFVHWASKSSAHRAVAAGLRAVERTGGLLRLRFVQLGAVRLLRRIEAGRGARAALAATARRPAVHA